MKTPPICIVSPAAGHKTWQPLVELVELHRITEVPRELDIDLMIISNSSCDICRSFTLSSLMEGRVTGVLLLLRTWKPNPRKSSARSAE
jgi:hypothetical protein